jgi:N-acetylglutamate synthase-like GNAT family acetyltransferase
MSPLTVRVASREDIPTIEKLLTAEWLPAMAIEEFIDSFWVLDRGGEVLGAAGMEMYGDLGFLRSVVVSPELRGTGEGDRLVSEALAHAKQHGARRVYLFTMNAAPFFARYGFQPITMDDFEPSVRDSWQYVGLSQMPEIAQRITPMRMDLA